MKKLLVTDLLEEKQNNLFQKKEYLELPIYKNNQFDKKIIFYKKWKKYKYKIDDYNKIYNLYHLYLNKLIFFLNQYHKTKRTKKYWTILLTPWLINFISSVFIKWKFLENLEKKYFFIKKKMDSNNMIPTGIEDFHRISISHYWNHYLFTRIIEKAFKKKIQIKKKFQLKKNNERDLIYSKLKNKKTKDRVFAIVQKILNYFRNPKYLIFSTYMTNFQEILVNIRINKSILLYKSPRPFHLTKYYNKGILRKKMTLDSSRSKKDKLKIFLDKEVIMNIPSSFLENYKSIGNDIKNIPFPKKPEKIFTTLGINRSTIMDRYIANNVEKGSKLILAQHGGNYFQHKCMYHALHEVNISDKFLTWGKISKKKTIRLGVIKNIKKSKSIGDKIIVEIRMRRVYQNHIKIDSGFYDGKKYLDNMCDFFNKIKNDEINNEIFVKLHHSEWGWNEKKLFLTNNPKLKFINSNKKMIDIIDSAKLMIYTFCSSGYLESIAANKPTIVLYLHDLNLLNDKTKKHFKILKKNGILHTDINSLIRMLKKYNHSDKIQKWWCDKKIQKLVSKYREDFCFYNNDKLNDLKNIIVNENYN